MLVILKNIISLIPRKKHKLVKRSRIITQQPKTIEISNIVDIKSVNTDHPKNSHKLSKTIRQAEKVSQESGAAKNSDSSSYSEVKKGKFFG